MHNSHTIHNILNDSFEEFEIKEFDTLTERRSTTDSDYEAEIQKKSSNIRIKKSYLFTLLEEENMVSLSLKIEIPLGLSTPNGFEIAINTFNNKLSRVGISDYHLDLNFQNYRLYPAKKNGEPKKDWPFIDEFTSFEELNIDRIAIIKIKSKKSLSETNISLLTDSKEITINILEENKLKNSNQLPLKNSNDPLKGKSTFYNSHLHSDIKSVKSINSKITSNTLKKKKKSSGFALLFSLCK